MDLGLVDVAQSLTYAYNAAVVSEMLAPRWMNRMVLPFIYEDSCLHEAQVEVK